MKKKVLYLLSLSVLLACSPKQQQLEKKDVWVTIDNKTLTKTEINARIPKGSSPSDSLLYAENYVKKWIKEELIYKVALQNIGDDIDEVEELVEDYRHSLISHRYQERLIAEWLRADITDEDCQTFYDENPDKMLTERGLIKGLFLKVPIDAPKLQEVKKWYKSTDADDFERIEKYSIQNAVIYEYFYDHWRELSAIMRSVPFKMGNVNSFLQKNKSIEVSDSSFCYLLHIEEFIAPKEQAPFEYMKPRITEFLVNKRKVDFLKKFEEDLYNDALWSGEVDFANEDEK